MKVVLSAVAAKELKEGLGDNPTVQPGRPGYRYTCNRDRRSFCGRNVFAGERSGAVGFKSCPPYAHPARKRDPSGLVTMNQIGKNPIKTGGGSEIRTCVYGPSPVRKVAALLWSSGCGRVSGLRLRRGLRADRHASKPKTGTGCWSGVDSNCRCHRKFPSSNRAQNRRAFLGNNSEYVPWRACSASVWPLPPSPSLAAYPLNWPR
jgi:hypothetical protein